MRTKVHLNLKEAPFSITRGVRQMVMRPWTNHNKLAYCKKKAIHFGQPSYYKSPDSIRFTIRRSDLGWVLCQFHPVV